MHGPSLATLLVVALLGMAPASPPGPADVIAEARRKLDRGDGVAAVAILEEALPSAGSDKDAVLGLLQKAYEAAAKQAQAAGRVREAETYRENLKILNRKPRAAKVTPVEPPKVQPEPEVANDPPPLPTPLLDSPTPPVDVEPLPPIAPNPSASSSPVEVPPISKSAEALLPMPVEAPMPDLATADAAFAAKNYGEAGRIYASLDREKQLPADHRDLWLYCRASEVVNRINAHPRTETEWSSVKAEIEKVRLLNPKNILGEYLKDLVGERYAAWKKVKPAKTLVVRGSAPEEPPPVDRPVRTASNVAPTEAPAPTPIVTPVTNPPPPAKPVAPVNRWQMLDTANFRIYHVDPALAAKVGQAAETARREQTKRWSKQNPKTNWQPLCEIYLYPTAKQYAVMTGQPEDSPGFSTMGMNAGRIISRRVNLRADHPTLVEAVLPHEITHVILADYFTEQQIPRWADEGLAVLAEPANEQQRRAADLVGPLAANRLFPVDALMKMDYPDEKYWGLYYAQSVSLTRFLVEQGTSAQMIQFLQTSQREGYEPALKRVYKIEGFADLQRRWLAYAQAKTPPPSQTAAVPATEPILKVR